MPTYLGPAAFLLGTFLCTTSWISYYFSFFIEPIALIGNVVKFPSIFFHFVPSIFSLYTTLWLSMDVNFDRIISNPPNHLTYDYIIIGAGTTGSVIANRLSSDPLNEILVLDAGGIPSMANTIPSLTFLNMVDSRTFWSYKSVPQKHCCNGVVDSSLPYLSGQSLGGSSNFNLMPWVRGSSKDYDTWANEIEDEQWTYNSLLPFFKKSENYQGYFPDENVYGTNGPITISRQESKSLELWLNSGFIDGNQTREFYPVDVTIKDGRRQGTYWTYLLPIANAPNVTIVKFAFVTQIIIDPQTKRATGVKYVRNGETIIANARKEVILCAGAFNSPKLLMLSGVGPTEHLKSLEITPILDLPVGNNFIDMPGTFLPFLVNSSISFGMERDLTLGTVVQGFYGKGPLSTNFASGYTFHSTSANEKDQPDIQYYLCNMGLSPPFDTVMEQVLNVKHGTFTDYMKSYYHRDLHTILGHLVTPFSKGTVRLASKNPFDDPLIDPNIFSDARDLERLIKGMRYIIEHFETSPAYQSVNATFFPNPVPGCEGFAVKSDEYLKCHVMQLTLTKHFHAIGTCKMGKPNDPTAVVDSNLRVLNISGLRVADASIMPFPPNGFSNAPFIMIGEKAASLILKDSI